MKLARLGELHEISHVGRDEHAVLLVCSLEHAMVGEVQQAPIPQVDRVDAIPPEPLRHLWGKIFVEEQLHAGPRGRPTRG